MITIAAAQYPIDRLEDWQAYETKLSGWVGEAARKGADLAIFPEYGAMELASLSPESAGDLQASLTFVASLVERIDALHSDLAREFDMHIVAASLPVIGPDGRPINRARIFAPNGRRGHQDKLVMTRFENEQWRVAKGAGLQLFDTEIGQMGIAICYDSEFPLISRALREAGADILIVPSCTDSLHGYWRVRHGCQARALENQMLVVQSPTVGIADWSPAVDVNRGAAGFYVPPDGDFPDDGVLAAGKLDDPVWVTCEIDLDRIRRLRDCGSVLNNRDWSLQPGAGDLPKPDVIDLRG